MMQTLSLVAQLFNCNDYLETCSQYWVCFVILLLPVYTGCRMGFYEWIRDHILGKNQDGTYPFWLVLISLCHLLLQHIAMQQQYLYSVV